MFLYNSPICTGQHSLAASYLRVRGYGMQFWSRTNCFIVISAVSFLLPFPRVLAQLQGVTSISLTELKIEHHVHVHNISLYYFHNFVLHNKHLQYIACYSKF